MPTYHLRRTMHFACGKDGSAFDRDVIVAPDAAAAITLAAVRTAVPVGLVLTSLMLCAASGAVLWSRSLAEGGWRLQPATS